MFLPKIFLFSIAFILTISSIDADKYKTVKTKNGDVRGIRKTSLLKNVPFYAFKGIPYAKPPVDDLRFKAPEPINLWKPKVLDAFEYGDMCIQPGKFMPGPYAQSEDCLTLNIFVPDNVKSKEKLAVLFFIHGGAFTDGSSHDSLYGPDFIIEQATILVTINYRMGALGFLSIDLPEYSGNMGLKDQQLALKWINENIDRFGGDNNRITVFGHSAGGVSTHLHVLSAESRKYFRNAIPMSGVAFNTFGMSPDQNRLEQAHNIAKEMGNPKNSVDELLAFLKQAPAEDFNRFAIAGAEGGARLFIPLAPIIERKDAKRAFIVETPEKLYEMSTIDVDAMFTGTSREAMSMVPKLPAPYLQMLDANFNPPLAFNLNLSLESKEHHILTDAIRKFYFGDGAIDEATVPQLFDFLSDMNFVLGIDKGVKLQAAQSSSKAYYLRFSVDSTLNLFKKTQVLRRDEICMLPGAAHGDDLCYLFRCELAKSDYDRIIETAHVDEQSKISLQTIDSITKLYTNFAKYGVPSYQNNPVDGFQPVQLKSADGFHFVDITNNGLTVGLRPHEKVIEFWTNTELRAIQIAANAK